MFSFLRTNFWWSSVVPQVLGWLYFCMVVTYVSGVDIGLQCFTWFNVMLFFFALIGVSSFGYLFNDWCDIDSDLKAGKKNSLALLTYPGLRFLVVVVPLSIGTFSWILLQRQLNHGFWHISNTLYVLQIVLLIAYSMPPLRLKERSVLGALADATYGHVNPAFVTLTAFYPPNCWEHWATIGAVILLILTYTKGIRNILLHQIEDRRADKKSGINTVPLYYGPISVVNFINKFLLPVEMIALSVWIVWAGFKIPPLVVAFVLFLAISYLKFSGWKLGYLPKRQLRFKFLHFTNDFFEGWIPVFLLLFLSVKQPQYFVLLGLHLLMFPAVTGNFIKDLKRINENFKTEDNY